MWPLPLSSVWVLRSRRALLSLPPSDGRGSSQRERAPKSPFRRQRSLSLFTLRPSYILYPGTWKEKERRRGKRPWGSLLSATSKPESRRRRRRGRCPKSRGGGGCGVGGGGKACCCCCMSLFLAAAAAAAAADLRRGKLHNSGRGRRTRW